MEMVFETGKGSDDELDLKNVMHLCLTKMNKKQVKSKLCLCLPPWWHKETSHREETVVAGHDET